MAHDLIRGGEGTLIVLVLAGAVPELAATWQFLLAGAHFRRHHYAACAPAFPRTAIASSAALLNLAVIGYTCFPRLFRDVEHQLAWAHLSPQPGQGWLIVSPLKELRGAEMKWDKTEKTGRVAIPT